MNKLILLLSTTLLLMACGSDEPSAKENESMEEAFNESSEAISDKGTRSNPYQIGDTAEITVTDMDDDYNDLNGTANVTISNVLRGEAAYNHLNDHAAGTHAQPDDTTLEWITFDVTFELTDYVDDDTAYIVRNNYTVFNENGEQVSATTAAMETTPANSVFRGNAVESPRAYTAPKDGTFLLKFTEANEDVFFEVK